MNNRDIRLHVCTERNLFSIASHADALRVNNYYLILSIITLLIIITSSAELTWTPRSTSSPIISTLPLFATSCNSAEQHCGNKATKRASVQPVSQSVNKPSSQLSHNGQDRTQNLTDSSKEQHGQIMHAKRCKLSEKK